MALDWTMTGLENIFSSTRQQLVKYLVLTLRKNAPALTIFTTYTHRLIHLIPPSTISTLQLELCANVRYLEDDQCAFHLAAHMD